MDNYEYLIAGLPVLSSDWSAQKHLSATALIDEIRSLSSDRDNALYDTLLSGYEEDWTRILSSRTKRDSRKPMWSGVSWKEPTC